MKKSQFETRIGDRAVRLHSFVMSNTPSHVMCKLWGVGNAEMEQNNILFQEEDKDRYIRAIFKDTD